MSFKQPEPTKAFAIYMSGGWYGEGDTPRAAWDDAKRQIAPHAHSVNAGMWRKLRDYGSARKVETAAQREKRESLAVADYVSAGLGE